METVSHHSSPLLTLKGHLVGINLSVNLKHGLLGIKPAFYWSQIGLFDQYKMIIMRFKDGVPMQCKN